MATGATAAPTALFFLFEPTAAQPGATVAVRLGGTPLGFTAADRERPLRRPIRLYLVENRTAGDVRSRFDDRLHFVGILVPDRNSRGVLTFAAPPLDSSTYAVAAWCPGCARYSFGRTFFVQTIPRVSRFRGQLGLRIRMPSAVEACPVTIPRDPAGRYGNGLLSRNLTPDGVLPARKEPDGTLFQKLWWVPRGLTGVLTVRGERLDAPSPPLRVLGVNWGYSSTGQGSWASAIAFPSTGCWRITGRVRDISLSFVVSVVARP